MFLYTFLDIVVGSSELGIAPVDAPTAQDSVSLLELLIKGGFIMIPILLLSMLSVYFFVERFLAIKSSVADYSTFISSITPSIKSGDIVSAKVMADKSRSVLGKIISRGISKIGQPVKHIETALENTARVEVMKLEKNLTILSIVSSIAPMMGFVGTISGVIKIFYNISLADNISIGLIAGGLYEKMVTSAAGLVVGILAHLAHNYLTIMLDGAVIKIETASQEFLDLVSE